MDETLEKEELKSEILPSVYVHACYMKRKLVIMRISLVFCRRFTGLSNCYPLCYIHSLSDSQLKSVFASN